MDLVSLSIVHITDVAFFLPSPEPSQQLRLELLVLYLHRVQFYKITSFILYVTSICELTLKQCPDLHVNWKF